MSYDTWLEKPYQDAYAESERLTCPRCDGRMEDDGDGGVDCTECDYADGPDWDAMAEAAAEAREMDDPGRLTW